MNDELKLPCLWCRELITEKQDLLGYCVVCAGTFLQKTTIEHYRRKYGTPPPIREEFVWEEKRNKMNEEIEAVKRKYFCFDDE
jgi:hypothetical protein